MYINAQITVNTEFAEILIAELAEIGFDTFTEHEAGIEAFALEKDFRKELLEEVINRYTLLTDIEYSTSRIEKQNWNEEWEKNYDPIKVKDQILVRATFHKPDAAYPYEIIIDPKMSFGTGHHATTSLMLENQLEIDHIGKRLLDAGTGTGILAIMAEKLGAKHVIAYDIDEWPVENTKENILLNGCKQVIVYQGTISTIPVINEEFDIILANINRNVLLEEIPQYSRLLVSQGYLILSGFYQEDLSEIKEISKNNYLSVLKTKVKDNWVSSILVKNN